MKAIAISDLSGGSAWSSEHTNWHYSSKQSQNLFHPVNLPREDKYTSKPSGVSRSLFGPSDPLESRQLEYEEFSSQRFSDQSRWNFDFYQEKPISGRFEWKKVSNNRKETKMSPNNQVCESFWPRSPKKYSSSQGKLLFHSPKFTLSVPLLCSHVDLFILNFITTLLWPQCGSPPTYHLGQLFQVGLKDFAPKSIYRFLVVVVVCTYLFTIIT